MWAVRPVRSKQSLTVFCHRLKNQPSALVSASASLVSGDTLVHVHACAHGRQNSDLKKKAVDESNNRVLASIKDKETSQCLPLLKYTHRNVDSGHKDTRSEQKPSCNRMLWM